MTYLEITTKNGLGRRTVELGDKPLRVGRSGDNDIVLRDTRVSRHHCIIEVINGKPLIRDLGSVRGIKINNRKREESDLRAGDRVRIGPFTIALREQGAVTMERASASHSTGSQHEWDNHASEGDETSVPMEQDGGLGTDSRSDTPNLSDSQGDSHGTARGDSSATPAVDQAALRRLDELAANVANLENALSNRDDAMASILSELRDVRSAQDAAASASSQRHELSEQIAQIEIKLSQRDEAINSVLSELRELRSAHEVAVQSATQRDELSEAAQRIDDLAQSQERLSSEQAQLGGALQDLAARLASIDESLRSMPMLVGRLQALEETAQQSALQARQALEGAAQLTSRVEEVHEFAHRADQRVTDVALEQADSAAQVKAQEETINHGTQQLMRLAKLIEEATRQQHEIAGRYAQTNSAVQALSQQLSQVRERCEYVEKRLSDTPAPTAGAPVPQPDISSQGAQLLALREAHQKEIASIRHSFEAVGARLATRIERLEGASADAAPELSALKEQVRRLSDGHHREVAAPRVTAAAARSAPTTATHTAVLDRPAPAPPATRPAPATNGVPPSVDSEQSRKVMNRIFHGKREPDDRYRPARDHSAIFFLVLVGVFALGVAVILLGQMLLK